MANPWITCSSCGGSKFERCTHAGYVDRAGADGIHPDAGCPGCHGTGWTNTPCFRCDGAGGVYAMTCDNCNGTGKVNTGAQ